MATTSRPDSASARASSPAPQPTSRTRAGRGTWASTNDCRLALGNAGGGEVCVLCAAALQSRDEAAFAWTQRPASEPGDVETLHGLIELLGRDVQRDAYVRMTGDLAPRERRFNRWESKIGSGETDAVSSLSLLGCDPKPCRPRSRQPRKDQAEEEVAEEAMSLSCRVWSGSQDRRRLAELLPGPNRTSSGGSGFWMLVGVAVFATRSLYRPLIDMAQEPVRV
jgi:hypothetical protein